MPERQPTEWTSLSDLLLALRRDEFLAGPFESDLFHPETGAHLGKSRTPPYLYRGEPFTYPSTSGGLWRAQTLLSSTEFEYLQRLVLSAASELSQKSKDELAFGEAVAYAQHYGFPTPLVDFSSSLYVSAHFAVGPYALSANPDTESPGCFMRLNLRRAQEQMQLLRPTMLGNRFTRPTLQHAWTIEPPAAVGDHEGERREDDYWRNLKSAFFLESGIIEIFRWKRNPAQDRLFFNPFVDCPVEDPYVAWPVLLVNQFVEEHGPMSERLASLLLGRLPLYHMVCFSTNDPAVESGEELRPPSHLYCAGVHPGRTWDPQSLSKRWSGESAA